MNSTPDNRNLVWTVFVGLTGAVLVFFAGVGAVAAQEGMGAGGDRQDVRDAPDQEEGPQRAQGRDNLSAQAQALLSADIRLGPFSLQPRLGASSGWQSVPRAQSISGEIEGDFNATLQSGLGVVLDVREAHRIRANLGIGYTWFREFESLSALNGNVSGAYSFIGNRFSFRLSNAYFNRERNRFTPVRDGEPLPGELFEIDDNLRVETNDLSSEVEYQATDRVRLNLAAGRQTNDFEGVPEVAESANGVQVRVRPGFEYAVTRNTTLGLSYEMQNRSTDDPDSTREYRRDSAGVQLQWDSAGLLATGGSVHYTRLEPEDDGSAGFEGFRLDGNMTVRPSEILRFSLSGSRGLFPSVRQGNLYGVRTGGSATVDLALTSTLFVGVDGSYFVHDYPVPDLDEEAATREDTLINYGGTVNWQFARTTGVNFRLGRFERRTNVAGAAIDGLIASGGLSFRY